MNICYICQYFPPEMGAPAARASELARHWVRMGHQVTVLTGFPNHPTGVLRPEYRSRFRRLVCRENVDGINVVRTWLLPFPNRKTYERILNYSSFCLSAAATGSFLRRPDVVIATSPQLLVGLSGWWMGQVKSAPVVLEVRDLWPESLTGVGLGNQNSPMARTLRAIAGFLYQRSDHIAVVTPAFKDYLVANCGMNSEKISIVENGVETGIFSPTVSGAEIRRELGLEGKFVVSYIGTLGIAHGLSTMIEAAERLQTTLPDVVLLLVGEGADKERLLVEIEKRKLSNLRFMPQQSRERIPSIIRASNACLVLLRKAEIFETVIPTKMLEFMACGRPVILGVDGQARKILDECEAGIFVEPEDPHRLAQAIEQIHASPELGERLGANGHHYIAENLSREKTARKYIELLEHLVERKPASKSKSAKVSV